MNRDYLLCPAKNFPESHEINPLLIRSLFGQDPFILASFVFRAFMDPAINMQK